MHFPSPLVALTLLGLAISLVGANRKLPTYKLAPARAPRVQGLPRFVIYAQTHHDKTRNNQFVSLKPLVYNRHITHVYIAAFHINGPGAIHLNDWPPEDRRHDRLWSEMHVLQQKGIKVMAMLGGAAQGSYGRLSASDPWQVRFQQCRIT
jgi:hypothetical protein